jgi:hypothetical protein
LLSLFWNEKKNVGHYFLSNLRIICGYVKIDSKGYVFAVVVQPKSLKQENWYMEVKRVKT